MRATPGLGSGDRSMPRAGADRVAEAVVSRALPSARSCRCVHRTPVRAAVKPDGEIMLGRLPTGVRRTLVPVLQEIRDVLGDQVAQSTVRHDVHSPGDERSCRFSLL